MDLNYDIDTWVMPLYSMVLTNITGQIVKASIISPVPTLTETIITKRASEKAMALPLPEPVKRKIKDMIHDLMTEILEWYNINGECIPLTLTMHGLVDEASSARVCLRTCTTKAIGWQYEMACDHCLEDDIFLLGRHLSSEEKSAYEDYPLPEEEYPGTLGRFWYHIHQGRFDKKIRLKDLSDQQCIEGLEHAVFRCSKVAIKYFMTVASSPEALKGVSRKQYYYFNTADYLFTPTIYVAFLKASQEAADLLNMFSMALLRTLLKRPYKHLFLKAAESLFKNLKEKNAVCLAGDIALSVSRGLEDRDLFLDFWKMELRCWRHRYVGNWKTMMFLLQYVLSMGDKQDAIKVYDGIFQADKADLYKPGEHCLSIKIYYFQRGIRGPRSSPKDLLKEKPTFVFEISECFLALFKSYQSKEILAENVDL